MSAATDGDADDAERDTLLGPEDKDDGKDQGGRRKSINFVLEAFSTHFSLNRVEFFDSAAVRQPAKSLRLAGGAVARGAQGS